MSAMLAGWNLFSTESRRSVETYDLTVLSGLISLSLLLSSGLYLHTYTCYTDYVYAIFRLSVIFLIGL